MSNRPEDDVQGGNGGGGVLIPLREWELNETSSTYDHLVAAPSDETMQSQWILFLTILVSSLIWMLFVFGSMLGSKHCRRNSFNTYILFLMVPDILFNLCCTLSCALNLHLGRYISVNGCIFQSLYSIFAVSSSAWINAMVLYQLHRMLWCSRKVIRYHPPTRTQVVQQCSGIYLYSIFMATWSNWGQDESWWPIRNNVYSGIYCLPMPYDLDSSLFFYLLYAPLVFLIPFMYICYVVVDMLYHQLLPKRDQRKTLMVFLRLLLVYFVMWIPGLGLAFVGGNFLTSWWIAIGGAWVHAQGAVSAAICVFKPDIKRACQNTLRSCCCCCTDRGETLESKPAACNSATSKSSSREIVLAEAANEDDDNDSENNVAYQNQRSLEFFLGTTEEEMTTIRESAQKRRKHARMERRISCPSPASTSSRKVQRGGVVRTSSAYELSLGLMEPGELSSLRTLVAAPGEEGSV